MCTELLCPGKVRQRGHLNATLARMLLDWDTVGAIALQ
jgi:hypothetical protein